MKVAELLAAVRPVKVPKANNLRYVGWHDGYMLVQFQSSDDVWIYGPGIPEEELAKLLRVPYPDSIFQSNIKTRYKAYKVPE